MFPIIVRREVDLLVVYGQLDAFRGASSKQCCRRQRSQIEVATENGVQICHSARFCFNRGRKQDPFTPSVGWEKVNSGIPSAKPC